MSNAREMTESMARSLLEAALLRLRLSRDGSIRIDEVEGRAIELLLRRGPARTVDPPVALAPSLPGANEGEASAFEAGATPWAGKLALKPRATELMDLELDLSSVRPEAGEDGVAVLCLDFGTAFTKAYAMRGWSDPVDISLGSYAGGDSPLMVESSVWIDDDGIHFGPDATSRTASIPAGRRRFDSMKRRLLDLESGEVRAEPVSKDLNPLAGDTDFTELGLLTLYLAYVTHLLSTALQAEGLPRHLPRRLTRPCWNGDSGKSLSSALRLIVAKATIIADTLGNSLVEGLDPHLAASALAAVDQVSPDVLSSVVESLLREDLSEPEAVAAPFEADSDWHFLTVVDVGAGTTDTATFLLRAHPKWERGKISLVPGSRASLGKAGDEVDRILLEILRGELSSRLDEGDAGGLDAWLCATIRDHKLRLFRDEIVEVEFAGATAMLDLEEFLASDGVKRLEDDMVGLLGRSFQAMPANMTKRIVEKGGVRLLLSGGGAGLPMAKGLANRPFLVDAGAIWPRITDARPDWESSKDDEFRSIYPQLAVAVGGASPFLPEVA